MQRTNGSGGPPGERTRPVLVAAVLLTVFAVSLGSSCHNSAGKSESAGNGIAPLPEDAGGSATLSKKVDLYFYLDASGSMKNFLVAPQPGHQNYYERVLNRAGNILSESWDANVSFWSFGVGEPQRMGSEGLEKYLSPSAYKFQETHIEEAIRHKKSPAGAERHQVKVIVTDLWQDRDGAGDLAQLLDEMYLNQENGAVGVLGIRSAFHGKPDLTPADPDAADSMPFYFLIGGQAPDVRFAIKQLIEDLKVSDKDHFQIVFTQRPVEHLVHNLTVSSADKKGASQDERQVPGSKGRFPVLIYVRHDEVLNMEEPPEQQRLSLGPHVKLNLHPKVTGIAYRRGQASEDPKAADQVTVNLGVEPRQITIHRSELDANTVYRFRIDLVEDWNKLEDLESWNLEAKHDLTKGRFPEVNGSRPGRTLSLSHFLNVLRVKMAQHETPMARYYLYVQTN